MQVCMLCCCHWLFLGQIFEVNPKLANIQVCVISHCASWCVRVFSCFADKQDHTEYSALLFDLSHDVKTSLLPSIICIQLLTFRTVSVRQSFLPRGFPLLYAVESTSRGAWCCCCFQTSGETNIPNIRIFVRFVTFERIFLMANIR